MIMVYYQSDSSTISSWQERLDRISLKYELIKQNAASVPMLVDGEKQVEGISAIEAYLDSLEQFVKDWYEDRCDRYDFDPDAQNYTGKKI